MRVYLGGPGSLGTLGGGANALVLGSTKELRNLLTEHLRQYYWKLQDTGISVPLHISVFSAVHLRQGSLTACWDLKVPADL